MAFRPILSITVFDTKYVGPPEPPPGGRVLKAVFAGAGFWTPAPTATIDPAKHTLLLLHGVGSSVEEAFPGTTEPPIASRIMSEGSYDQVIGFDYDWTQPPSVVATQLVDFVNSLNLKEPLDVVAHSYGSIIALAAIPDFNIRVDNLVTLGGPLG
jgi:pimeloyl-ACP methyl ester carboxylesterase